MKLALWILLKNLLKRNENLTKIFFGSSYIWNEGWEVGKLRYNLLGYLSQFLHWLSKKSSSFLLKVAARNRISNWVSIIDGVYMASSFSVIDNINIFHKYSNNLMVFLIMFQNYNFIYQKLNAFIILSYSLSIFEGTSLIIVNIFR